MGARKGALEMMCCIESTGVGHKIFRFGLRMRFPNFVVLRRIASFEHCLQGAPPSSLTLPYPFHTWRAMNECGPRGRQAKSEEWFVFWTVISAVSLEFDVCRG